MFKTFSTQLHFWNSRKQWNAFHPSKTAIPLVRQEERTPSKQQWQETGAKKHNQEKGEKDSKHKSILL